MTTEMRKEELLKAAEQLKWGITAYVDAITALHIDAITALHIGMIPDVATIEVGEIADDVADDAAKIKPMVTEKKSAESKKAPAKKEEIVEDTAEDDTEESVSYTKEDLDQMTFNDLRKLAKELGLKVKGDRETIAKAILASNATAESEDGEVEEKPSKTKKAPAKRVAIPKEEDEEVEDDEEDDVDDIDEITQNVLDIVENMETSEIADILSDAGLSPKGKRQALIDKVIKAVKDGTISIDDEDDGEDAEEDEDTAEDTEDGAEDFGPNDFDNPNMTDERREALEALDGQLRKDCKAKKLKLVTMKKELKAFYDGDDEALEAIAEMKSDEILDNYIDMKQLFIDDDGEENETESPYSVNGEYYCCGMPLTYNEDDNTFICEVCGSEYNADE